MLNKDQSQEAGSNSTALQAGRDVNLTIGISAQDARAIALDVAKVTFYELSGQARETMSSRVEEITDTVISRLQQEYPEGLAKAVEPDFQYALLSVQKQYGRTGDEDLGSLLVDLLIDRSKQDSRNLKQIVLNESLEVAPKLTTSQISALSIIFLFGHVQYNKISSHQSLWDFFDTHVKPSQQHISKNRSDFQHLQFAGCGSIQMGDQQLAAIIRDSYSGLFMKGLTADEVMTIEIPPHLRNVFLLNCVNDPSKLQINALNLETLDFLMEKHGLVGSQNQNIKTLFESNKLPVEEVLRKCVENCPYLEDLNEYWKDSEMNSFMLTSVGIAIGHANIKKSTTSFGDLSIWID